MRQIHTFRRWLAEGSELTVTLADEADRGEKPCMCITFEGTNEDTGEGWEAHVQLTKVEADSMVAFLAFAVQQWPVRAR